MFKTSLVLGAVLVAVISLPANAQSALPISPDPLSSAVFAFGGRYFEDNFTHHFYPFLADYEDNFMVGGGYQHFVWSGAGFSLGGEVGGAVRFGQSPVGAEVWAGAVARYDGWAIGNVKISPALTFGLSYETGPVGVEVPRAAWYGGDPTLLFYLSPELNFSLADNPGWEVFIRAQHRSGAWQTLGNYGDGANATTIGLRLHF